MSHFVPDGDDEDYEEKETELTTGRGAHATNPLSSMVSALGAVPLGVMRGATSIEIPEIMTGERRARIPQHDGWLRDDTGALAEGQKELAPFNAEWMREHMYRYQLTSGTDDVLFFKQTAGAINTQVEDFYDFAAAHVEQRARAQLERQRIELRRAREKGRTALLADLTTVEGLLNVLKEKRASERTMVWAPMNTWLNERGLTRYLDTNVHRSYFFPLWMRWQYLQLQDVANRHNGLAPAQFQLLSEDDKDVFNTILDVDDLLYTLPSSADRQQIRIDLAAGTISYDDLRHYVTNRECRLLFNEPAPAVWTSEPKNLGNLDVCAAAMRVAMEKAIATLPGMTEFSPPTRAMQKHLQEHAGTVGMFHVSTSPPGSPPAHRLSLFTGETYDATGAVVNPASDASKLVKTIARTAVADYAKHLTEINMPVIITNMAAGSDAKKSVVDHGPLGTLRGLTAPIHRDAAPPAAITALVAHFNNDYFDYLIGTRVAAFNATRERDALRYLVPSIYEYTLAAAVIEACAGGTIWRMISDLFMPPPLSRLPFFSVPLVTSNASQTGNEQVANLLARVPGSQQSDSISGERYYYTTISTNIGSLQLGDLVKYVTYAKPVFVDFNDKTTTHRDATPVALSPITDVKALVTLLTIKDPAGLNNKLALPASATAANPYIVNEAILATIVIPALLDGGFVRALGDALGGGIMALEPPGGALPVVAPNDLPLTWPLAPAQEPTVATDKAVYTEIINKVSSKKVATRAHYLRARTSLLAAVKERILVPHWAEIQAMSPLIRVLVFLDVLTGIAADVTKLDDEIAKREEVRDSITSKLQEVAKVDANDSSTPAVTPIESERTLFYPQASHMLKPMISGFLPLSERAITLLNKGLVRAKELARLTRRVPEDMVRQEDLTSMAPTADELRTAYIDVLANINHKLQIFFPTTYKKESETTLNVVNKQDVERTLAEALVRYYAGGGSRGSPAGRSRPLAGLYIF